MRNASLGPVMLIGAASAACMVGGLHLAGQPFDWRYGLLLAYFILVTWLLLRWQESVADQTTVFIRRFLAGLTIKLMGSVVLMVILVKTAPAALKTPMVIVFVGLYVLFTTFSVSRLMKVIRAPKA